MSITKKFLKLDPEYDAYDVLKHVIDDYSKKLIEEIKEVYSIMIGHLKNGHYKDFRRYNGKLREKLEELENHSKNKYVKNISHGLNSKLKHFKKNPYNDLKDDIENDLNELDVVSK